jgi:hypothetical protein
MLNTTGVTFNGISASFGNVASNGTFLTAIVPAGATTGPIAVTTPAGTENFTTDFVVTDAVTLTSFSPPGGEVGTEVSIHPVNWHYYSKVAP